MDVEVYLGSEDECERDRVISDKGFAPIVLLDLTKSIEPPKPEEDNEIEEDWGPLKRPCYKVITCDIKDEILDL
jgi:hypothetical protein